MESDYDYDDDYEIDYEHEHEHGNAYTCVRHAARPACYVDARFIAVL